MKKFFSLLILLSLATAANADVQTQEVQYASGGTQLTGFLAYDDAVKGKRPGVLVVHEWWGHNKHARQRATMLAQLGYTAFALDMSAGPKNNPRSEGLMGEASTRTTISSAPGTGICTVSSASSSVPSRVIFERISRESSGVASDMVHLLLSLMILTRVDRCIGADSSGPTDGILQQSSAVVPRPYFGLIAAIARRIQAANDRER